MTEKWELEDYKAPVDWEAVGPDLLAALERCRPFVEEHCIQNSAEDVGFADAAALAAADAAIAKAKNPSP